MSRQELAEAVNNYLWGAHKRRENLTENDIGRLERGDTRWPGEHRREAFRTVLHAASDTALGFYINRVISARPDGGSRVAALPSDGIVIEQDEADSADVSLTRADVGRTGHGTNAQERQPGDPGIAMSLTTRPLLAGPRIGANQDLAIAGTLGDLRQKLDLTLGAAVISNSTVDYWQSVADSYGRVYRTSLPAMFLSSAAWEVAELQALMDRHLPGVQRRGLCRAATQLAGLVATTLVNLDDYREARAWFQTARLAAEESEDAALQAWVMVRHAVSALYWNDPFGALDFATSAVTIARHIPCAAAAWAPAVQARAHSRLGPSHVEATRAALGQAEDAYLAYQAQPGERDAYGYSLAQLHFYRSNSLTEIGDTTPAYHAQETALAQYGPHAFLDPSLVRLDRAMCLVKDGESEEAARFATDSLGSLPNEHVAPIVIRRARQLAVTIPPACRSLGAVCDFKEVLAIETQKTKCGEQR